MSLLLLWRLQPVSSEIDLRWASVPTTLVHADLTLFWDAFVPTTAGANLTGRWEVATAVGASTVLRWDTRALVSSHTALLWRVRSTTDLVDSTNTGLLLEDLLGVFASTGALAMLDSILELTPAAAATVLEVPQRMSDTGRVGADDSASMATTARTMTPC